MVKGPVVCNLPRWLVTWLRGQDVGILRYRVIMTKHSHLTGRRQSTLNCLMTFQRAMAVSSSANPVIGALRHERQQWVGLRS